MSTTRCSITECNNKSARAVLLTCKGICKRSFHGSCLQLEANWTASRLVEFFICEACQNLEDMFRKMHDSLLSEFKKYIDEDKNLLAKAVKALEVNNEIMSESDITQSNLPQGRDSMDPKVVNQLAELKHDINGKLTDICNNLNKMTDPNTLTTTLNEVLKSVQDISSKLPRLTNEKDNINVVDLTTPVTSDASNSHCNPQEASSDEPTDGWVWFSHKRLYKKQWAGNGGVNLTYLNPIGFKYSLNESDKKITKRINVKKNVKKKC